MLQRQIRKFRDFAGILNKIASSIQERRALAGVLLFILTISRTYCIQIISQPIALSFSSTHGRI